MTERNVLELSLWVFTFGFTVKGIVFLFLWWKMRAQRDATRLGTVLRWHYVTLGMQAISLAFIYFYYGTQIRGWSNWLDVQGRVSTYLVATGLVLLATVFGIRLVFAYWSITNGAWDEPTNVRQDKRERNQNVRERFQGRIDRQQLEKGHLQNMQQLKLDAEQKRQDDYERTDNS